MLTVALTRDVPLRRGGARDVGEKCADEVGTAWRKVGLTHMHCGDLKVAVLHLDGNIVPVVDCHGPLHDRGRIQHVSFEEAIGQNVVPCPHSLTAMVMLKKRISFWFGAG